MRPTVAIERLFTRMLFPEHGFEFVPREELTEIQPPARDELLFRVLAFIRLRPLSSAVKWHRYFRDSLFGSRPKAARNLRHRNSKC
jgi:hypothetical protein